MVQKNDYIRLNDEIYKVLFIDDARGLVINCRQKTMPVWKEIILLNESEILQKEIVFSELGLIARELTDLRNNEFCQAHERYTMIAGILAFLSDDQKRNQAISSAVMSTGLSRRTITTYLCTYLITGSIASLCDRGRRNTRPLTADEKNMRCLN